MRIRATYSHLNGVEFLRFRLPHLWDEVNQVIEDVDAEKCKTKESKERGRQGTMLYSPVALNRAFSEGFRTRGWSEARLSFFATDDESLLRSTLGLPREEQRARIEAHNREAIPSYNQVDFVKERVAVEVQFGKYAFVAHDLFVKHLSFYVGDQIDLGIEILPMKSLEREMSSGVAYFERDLLNVVRQGRGVPAVPLIIFGLSP